MTVIDSPEGPGLATPSHQARRAVLWAGGCGGFAEDPKRVSLTHVWAACAAENRM